MSWGTLELEESKYSTESRLLNQLLLTMLVQPIYLPEFNEAYQSTCPDGKINQYKLQHFKRTEQQHNFFRVPFSFAEKILIHRDKIYSFCLVTLSMCHFSLTFLQCTIG